MKKFETVFLEHSEPVVMIEAVRVSDWKANTGSMVDGQFVESEEMNDYALACKIDPPADLVPVNGKDALVARAQSQCSGACWLSEEEGGTLAFMYSFEEQDEAEIRSALVKMRAKDWTKLDIGIAISDPKMALFSSLPDFEHPEVMEFQLAPGYYNLKHGVFEEDEEGEAYEFLRFVPGKPVKKKAEAALKKDLTLAELLKTGTESTFKKKKTLLDSKVEWTQEMLADAAVAVERLKNPTRGLVLKALEARKESIPTNSIASLQNYALGTEDPQLIGILFRFHLEAPDQVLLRIAELGFLEECRTEINSFLYDMGSFSLSTFSKLFASAKTGREVAVLSQILQRQIQARNKVGDFSSDRYLWREALGAGGTKRVDVREQMFYAMSAFLKELYKADSFLTHFDSLEEFLKLLGDTLNVAELASTRTFTVWLAALKQGFSSNVQQLIESQAPKIWDAILTAEATYKKWLGK